MNHHIFTGVLKELIDKADSGKSMDIDFIMRNLSVDSSLAMTRFVDYSLSRVQSEEGNNRLKFYLFNGSLIQRNYASLYFNRKGDWQIVREAFDRGLIDEIQAFAR